MYKRLDSPAKYFGGKSYLASKIVSLFPPHKVYVEPFLGMGSVLLAHDPENHIEIVNDLSRKLTNFWQVLQHEHLFQKFTRVIQNVPFSENEWKVAHNLNEVLGWNGDIPDEGRILRACNFFIDCRQSLAGRMDSFAPLSTSRTRRGMCEQASAWMSAVDGLPAVHERLRRVVILNRPAVEVIRKYDSPDCLFYLDPPYVHETRQSKDVYEHEMTIDDHKVLLDTVKQCKGAVFLSGYANELYDTELKDWQKTVFQVANHSSGAKSKRTMEEVLYSNR